MLAWGLSQPVLPLFAWSIGLRKLVSEAVSRATVFLLASNPHRVLEYAPRSDGGGALRPFGAELVSQFQRCRFVSCEGHRTARGLTEEARGWEGMGGPLHGSLGYLCKCCCDFRAAKRPEVSSARTAALWS